MCQQNMVRHQRPVKNPFWYVFFEQALLVLIAGKKNLFDAGLESYKFIS